MINRAILAFLLLGYFAALGAIYHVWNSLGHTIESEQHLARSIGEINRIDEVLTMSARLFAATGDEQWRERYAGHVDKLEDRIDETLDRFPDPWARSLVANTAAANNAMVNMEMRSFRLVDDGKQEEALRLLLSKEYRYHKMIYQEGLAGATQFLIRAATDQREAGRYKVASSFIALTVLGIAFILALLRQKQREAAVERRKTQVETMRIVATSSMDVVNNFINSMIYMRFKASRGEMLEDADLRLIDKAIEDAGRQMGVIASGEQMAQRDLGGISVLAPPLMAAA